MTLTVKYSTASIEEGLCSSVRTGDVVSKVFSTSETKFLFTSEALTSFEAGSEQPNVNKSRIEKRIETMVRANILYDFLSSCYQQDDKSLLGYTQVP